MTAPEDDDRTASLMTPAKLAQLKLRAAPAASPGAWLDQMAADAGSGHVRKLLELRQQVEAAIRGREGEFDAAAASCKALHIALEKLDFTLVQPRGLLARALGKGKGAASSYSTQHGRVVQAGDDLADDIRALQKQQAQAAGADRIQLEFDAEVHALEKIMEQGARWLQDMRNQLKTRQARGGDAAAQLQIREDTARCEVLVERLKVLRAVTSATQQAMQRCQAAKARRLGLVGTLQQLLDEEWKSGKQKLAVVARQVEEDQAATDGVERAGRAREALQSALKQAIDDCATVQALHQAAADELAALQVPLQAAC